jgi:UDP-N-acetylmuramoylalanine--D-glutamate ligase
MVGAMLAREGLPFALGGNIGIPMLGHLATATRETWCVLELSSFQLEDLTQSPRVAVVLNIFPDHLDRHRDMPEYTRAKGNIVLHQTADDTAVLNADDSLVTSLPHASKTRTFSLRGDSAAWFDGERLWLDPHPDPVMLRTDLRLLGLHNVANALAALLAAQSAGCSVEAMAAALRDFRPIHHRLELVGSVEAVTYVNDSIATTPGRSSAALRAIDEPVVLIAGGRHKNVPMNEWAELICRRARAVVVVGEAAPLIKTALEEVGARIPILSAKRFQDTVALAHEAAQPGDVVLLSPGCTSFDEFPDYTARGESFRASVAALSQRYGEPI